VEGMDVREGAPRRPRPAFWEGRRVLVTGHTGFKGAWLAQWLTRMGARVIGVSLPPHTIPDLYTAANVNSAMDALGELVAKARPEVVLHLAAQPLVRQSYRDPVSTFATNVMGTTHMLDALRRVDGCRVVVAVTTDKVYRNLEHPYPYRETDPLGGHDPYSASKAAAELVISSYRDAFLRERGVAVASARAGNVIGGGDWAEDRLIPDAIRAWEGAATLVVRRPGAVRPWQHVLEPLSGYLLLAERLWDDPGLSGSYNFGPRSDEAATVREVVELAQEDYPRASIDWGNGDEGPHEEGWLALEITSARNNLGFRPSWNLSETVRRTTRWYRSHAAGENAAMLCSADIAEFEGAAG
jgi:CDP-glucose 4,6-dehydratase